MEPNTIQIHRIYESIKRQKREKGKRGGKNEERNILQVYQTV